MKKTMVALFLGLLLNTKTFAAPAADARYFEIASDTTSELSSEMGPLSLIEENSTSAATDIEEASVIFEKMILIGEKIWKIVEAGKPVANFSAQRVDVLPQGVSKWQDLAGWQIPVSKRYERVIKNKWGSSVVTFRYRIIYNYGGNFNGQGSYLMGVTVYPEVVDVAWGWSFDATASIPTIANAGSTKNPVAAAEVLISSKIRTPLAHLDNTESYYVRADGAFVDLQN